MSRLLPLLVGIIVLAAWEVSVRWLQVPVFVLPPPSLIARSFIENGKPRAGSRLTTVPSRSVSGAALTS